MSNKPLTERPKVSQDVINIFSYLVDKQDRKGFAKYNSTIDDASDDMYDWLEMALEEAVDGMKYLVKENMRLRKENAQLKSERINYDPYKKPQYSDLDDE